MKRTIALVTACALLALATPVDAHEFQVGDYYVTPHPTHVADGEVEYQVWEETNGFPGLQKEAFIDEASGEEIPADDRVA